MPTVFFGAKTRGYGRLQMRSKLSETRQALTKTQDISGRHLGAAVSLLTKKSLRNAQKGKWVELP